MELESEEAAAEAALLYRLQFTSEQSIHVLRFQRVIALAIETLKFLTASFGDQEAHGLVTLRTKWRRGISRHGAHAKWGASLLLTVTIYCRGRVVIIHRAPPAAQKPVNSAQ